MEKDEIWDMYFKELHHLIASSRAGIERNIRREAKREFALRWPATDDEGVRPYADAAAGFLDERLYAYALDHVDRFLQAVSRGVEPGELAALELALSWYDWREEKAAIDSGIETGLNLASRPAGIVKNLIEEFGAFPDKTIIKSYIRLPCRNRLPDYVLAIALENAIGGEI